MSLFLDRIHIPCQGKQGFTVTGYVFYKFFFFRSRKWIISSDREDLLDEPLDKLSKKYFLCSAHFEEKWFLNPKFKTKFKKNVEAIPTIFLNNFTEFLPKSIQNRISSKMLHFKKTSVEVINKGNFVFIGLNNITHLLTF